MLAAKVPATNVPATNVPATNVPATNVRSGLERWSLAGSALAGSMLVGMSLAGCTSGGLQRDAPPPAEAASAQAGPPASAPPPADVHPTRPPPRPIYDVREPEPIEAGVAPSDGEYSSATDMLHYDIELSLSEASLEIEGRARLEFERLGSEAELGELTLDFTGLAVHAASVDSRPVPIRYESGKLFLPVRGAGRHTAEVHYRGTPDDGLILQNTLHGKPAAFADNWPNRARFWFPSVDHPADKATLSFTVHAPGAWEVISNGRMVSEPVPTAADALGGGEGRRTWRWASDVEHPVYTMVVGAAEFEIRSLGVAACGHAPASARADGCIDVSTWVFAPDTAAAAQIFARAPQMVDYYVERFGDFPYEKLAHVQSSTRFGGMENSSAIFYSEQAIASGTLSEGTVAHEIVHQWFGDSATEADWHHLWLSEGFASYFGYQFFQHADGEEAFRALLEGARLRVVGSALSGRPIVDPEESDLFALLNTNNYPKAAWVLHMLRGLLGDDTFFAGVRSYYGMHAGGTALTAEFQSAMEDVSGRDLGWFFEQWIFEPGYPVFDLEWSWDAAAGEVAVRVTQEQPADWPTFRTGAELELRLADGAQRRVVRLSDREHTFRFALDAEPTDVVLDPDGWILKKMVGE